MEPTDNSDSISTLHEPAYYARMREIAGHTGSASVWCRGYLLAADRPEVHFGALCAAGLGLRLSEDHYTEDCQDLGTLAWALHEGGIPRPSGQMFLCPDCLRENERVVRQMSEAASWHEADAADLEVSTLYFGDEDEIGGTREEVARGTAAE